MAEKIGIEVKFDRLNFARGIDGAEPHAYINDELFEKFLSNLNSLLKNGLSKEEIINREKKHLASSYENIEKINDKNFMSSKTEAYSKFKKENDNASKEELRAERERIETELINQNKSLTEDYNSKVKALKAFVGKNDAKKIEEINYAYTIPQKKAEQAFSNLKLTKARESNIYQGLVGQFKAAGSDLSGQKKTDAQIQYLLDQKLVSGIGKAREIIKDIESLPKGQQTDENIENLITSKARQEELKRDYSQNVKKGVEPSSAQKKGIYSYGTYGAFKTKKGVVPAGMSLAVKDAKLDTLINEDIKNSKFKAISSIVGGKNGPEQVEGGGFSLTSLEKLTEKLSAISANTSTPSEKTAAESLMKKISARVEQAYSFTKRKKKFTESETIRQFERRTYGGADNREWTPADDAYGKSTPTPEDTELIKKQIDYHHDTPLTQQLRKGGKVENSIKTSYDYYLEKSGTLSDGYGYTPSNEKVSEDEEKTKAAQKIKKAEAKENVAIGQLKEGMNIDKLLQEAAEDGGSLIDKIRLFFEEIEQTVRSYKAEPEAIGGQKTLTLGFVGEEEKSRQQEEEAENLGKSTSFSKNPTTTYKEEVVGNLKAKLKSLMDGGADKENSEVKQIAEAISTLKKTKMPGEGETATEDILDMKSIQNLAEFLSGAESTDYELKRFGELNNLDLDTIKKDFKALNPDGYEKYEASAEARSIYEKFKEEEKQKRPSDEADITKDREASKIAMKRTVQQLSAQGNRKFDRLLNLEDKEWSDGALTEFAFQMTPGEKRTEEEIEKMREKGLLDGEEVGRSFSEEEMETLSPKVRHNIKYKGYGVSQLFAGKDIISRGETAQDALEKLRKRVPLFEKNEGSRTVGNKDLPYEYTEEAFNLSDSLEEAKSDRTNALHSLYEAHGLSPEKPRGKNKTETTEQGEIRTAIKRLSNILNTMKIEGDTTEDEAVSNLQNNKEFLAAIKSYATVANKNSSSPKMDEVENLIHTAVHLNNLNSMVSEEEENDDKNKEEQEKRLKSYAEEASNRGRVAKIVRTKKRKSTVKRATEEVLKEIEEQSSAASGVTSPEEKTEPNKNKSTKDLNNSPKEVTTSTSVETISSDETPENTTATPKEAVSLASETKSFETVNESIRTHNELLKESIKLEQQKAEVSEKLQGALSGEAQGFKDVSKASKEHGKADSNTSGTINSNIATTAGIMAPEEEAYNGPIAFEPDKDFIKNHKYWVYGTGQTVKADTSSTAVASTINPYIPKNGKSTGDASGYLAKKLDGVGLNSISTIDATFMGMSQEDFDSFKKNHIKTVQGNVGHKLIELANQGEGPDSDKFSDYLGREEEILRKMGYDDEQISGLKDRAVRSLDNQNQIYDELLGRDERPKYNEITLGTMIDGESVAVTLDQLHVDAAGNAKIIDNKFKDKIGASEAIQLSIQENAFKQYGEAASKWKKGDIQDLDDSMIDFFSDKKNKEITEDLARFYDSKGSISTYVSQHKSDGSSHAIGVNTMGTEEISKMYAAAKKGEILDKNAQDLLISRSYRSAGGVHVNESANDQATQKEIKDSTTINKLLKERLNLEKQLASAIAKGDTAAINRAQADLQSNEVAVVELGEQEGFSREQVDQQYVNYRNSTLGTYQQEKNMHAVSAQYQKQMAQRLQAAYKEYEQANLNTIYAEGKVKDQYLGEGERRLAQARYEESQTFTQEKQANYENLRAQMEQMVNNGQIDPKIYQEAKDGIEDVRKQYSMLGKTAQMETFRQKGFFQQLKLGFKQSLRNLLDYQAAYTVIGYMKQGFQMTIQTAKELDAALVNLQIATNGTRAEAETLMNTYYGIADEMGRTASEVSAAANDWLRAGYDGQQAAELTKASMALSTLGMIESSQATEYLVSQLKGWKMSTDDVMASVDKLTALDAAAAITAGDLAEGMSRANVSAQLAGSSYDKFAAYITTVADVTQKSASSIGESFKTMYARYGNVKLGKWTPTEEDKNSEDFDAGNFENLNDIETALSKVGIAYRNSVNEVRDFDEVYAEIASKWDGMDKISQNAIAAAFGGTRQRENILVLFENWDKVGQFESIAANSVGTASEKMEAYNDSLAASANRVTNAFQEWVAAKGPVIEILKSFNDALTVLIKNLDGLIAIGGIAALVGFGPELVAGFGKWGAKLNNISVDGLKGFGEKYKGRLEGAKKEITDEDNYLKNVRKKDQPLIKAQDENTVATRENTQGQNRVITALDRATSALNRLGGQPTPNSSSPIPSGDGVTSPIKKRKISGPSTLSTAFSKKSGESAYKAIPKSNPPSSSSSATSLAIRGGASIVGSTLGTIGGSGLGAKIAKASGGDEGTGAIIGATVGGVAGQIAAAIPGPWGAIASVGVGVVTTVADQILGAEERNAERIRKETKELEAEIEAGTASLAEIEADSFKKRFEELSAGVDSEGRNLHLSDEDYSEYRDIIDKLTELNPQLIKVYDEEGKALIERNSILEESIRLLKEENEEKKKEKYTGEKWEQSYQDAYNAIYSVSIPEDEAKLMTSGNSVSIGNTTGFYTNVNGIIYETRDGMKVEPGTFYADNGSYNAFTRTDEGATTRDLSYYIDKGFKPRVAEDGSIAVYYQGTNKETNFIVDDNTGKLFPITSEGFLIKDEAKTDKLIQNRKVEQSRAEAQKQFQGLMAGKATSLEGFDELSVEQQQLLVSMTSNMTLKGGSKDELKKQVEGYVSDMEHAIEYMQDIAAAEASGIAVGITVPLTFEGDPELKNFGPLTLSEFLEIDGTIPEDQASKIREEFANSLLAIIKPESEEDALRLLVTYGLAPKDSDIDLEEQDDGSYKVADGQTSKFITTDQKKYEDDLNSYNSGEGVKIKAVDENGNGIEKNITEANLTSEQLKFASQYKNLVNGMTMEEFQSAFEEYGIKENGEIPVTVKYDTKGTAETLEAVEGIGSAVKQYKEDGYINSDSLEKLNEAWTEAGLSADKFYEVLDNGNGGIALTGNNLNEFVNSIIEAKYGTKALSAETIKLINSELEARGIFGFTKQAIDNATSSLYSFEDGTFSLKTNLTDGEQALVDMAGGADALTNTTAHLNEIAGIFGQSSDGSNTLSSMFADAQAKGLSLIEVFRVIYQLTNGFSSDNKIVQLTRQANKVNQEGYTGQSWSAINEQIQMEMRQNPLYASLSDEELYDESIKIMRTTNAMGGKELSPQLKAILEGDNGGLIVNSNTLAGMTPEDQERKQEDLTKKIKQNREEFFKDEIEAIDLLIAANEALNSVYEAQLGLLSSNNHRQKLDIMSSQYGLNQEKLSMYQEQYDKTMDWEPETAEGKQWKAEQLEKINQSILDTKKSMLSARKEAEQLRLEMVKMSTENSLDYLNREVEILDRRLNNLVSDDSWIDFDEAYGINLLPNLNDFDIEEEVGLDFEAEADKIEKLTEMRLEAAKEVAAEEAKQRKREIEDLQKELGLIKGSSGNGGSGGGGNQPQNESDANTNREPTTPTETTYNIKPIYLTPSKEQKEQIISVIQGQITEINKAIDKISILLPITKTDAGEGDSVESWTEGSIDKIEEVLTSQTTKEAISAAIETALSTAKDKVEEISTDMADFIKDAFSGTEVKNSITGENGLKKAIESLTEEGGAITKLKKELQDIKDLSNIEFNNTEWNEQLETIIDDLKKVKDKLNIPAAAGGGDYSVVYRDLPRTHGDFINPVTGGHITSPFGPRNSFTTENGQRASSNHKGIDIAVSFGGGEPILATKSGKVSYVGWLNGYGNSIMIDHGDGYVTRYSHMRNESKHKLGDAVEQGQVVGYIGKTGNSSGNHLDYGISYNGKILDPGYFVSYYSGTPDSSSRAKGLMLIGETYQDEIIGYKDGSREVVNTPTIRDRKDVEYVVGVEDTKKISYAGGAYSIDSRFFPILKELYNKYETQLKKLNIGMPELLSWLSQESGGKWFVGSNPDGRNVSWTSFQLYEGPGNGDAGRFNDLSLDKQTTIKDPSVSEDVKMRLAAEEGLKLIIEKGSIQGYNPHRTNYENSIRTRAGNSDYQQLGKQIVNGEVDLSNFISIKDVQDLILSKNPNALPRYGADGLLGSETKSAYKLVTGEDWISTEKAFEKLGGTIESATETVEEASKVPETLDSGSVLENFFKDNNLNLKLVDDKGKATSSLINYSPEDLVNLIGDKTSTANSKLEEYVNTSNASIKLNQDIIEMVKHDIPLLLEAATKTQDMDVLLGIYDLVGTLQEKSEAAQEKINSTISAYGDAVTKIIDTASGSIVAAVNDSEYAIKKLETTINRKAFNFNNASSFMMMANDYLGQHESQKHAETIARQTRDEHITLLKEAFVGMSEIFDASGLAITADRIINAVDSKGQINALEKEIISDAFTEAIKAGKIDADTVGRIWQYVNGIGVSVQDMVEAEEKQTAALDSVKDSVNKAFASIGETYEAIKNWEVNKNIGIADNRLSLMDTIIGYADSSLDKLTGYTMKESVLTEKNDAITQGLIRDDKHIKDLQATIFSTLGLDSSQYMRFVDRVTGTVDETALDKFISDKGYDESGSGEFLKEALNNLGSTFASYTEGQKNLITNQEAMIENQKQQLLMAAEMMNVEIKIDEVRLSITKGLNDWNNKFTSYRNDIRKELRSAKQMSQYLDADTRKLVFNEADYTFLLQTANDLEETVEGLYHDYRAEINALTEDTLWKESFITQAYEERLAIVQQEYDLAKARVSLEKSQQKLNNVLAEKNVRMLIDGEWRYVANANDVNQAQQEYDDALAAKEAADKEVADANEELEMSDRLREKQMKQEELKQRAENSEDLGKEFSSALTKVLGNSDDWATTRVNLNSVTKSVADIYELMQKGGQYEHEYRDTLGVNGSDIYSKSKEKGETLIKNSGIEAIIKELKNATYGSSEWKDALARYQSAYDQLSRGELLSQYGGDKGAVRNHLAALGIYEWQSSFDEDLNTLYKQKVQEYNALKASGADIDTINAKAKEIETITNARGEKLAALATFGKTGFDDYSLVRYFEGLEDKFYKATNVSDVKNYAGRYGYLSKLLLDYGLIDNRVTLDPNSSPFYNLNRYLSGEDLDATGINGVLKGLGIDYAFPSFGANGHLLLEDWADKMNVAFAQKEHATNEIDRKRYGEEADEFAKHRMIKMFMQGSSYEDIANDEFFKSHGYALTAKLVEGIITETIGLIDIRGIYNSRKDKALNAATYFETLMNTDWQHKMNTFMGSENSEEYEQLKTNRIMKMALQGTEIDLIAESNGLTKDELDARMEAITGTKDWTKAIKNAFTAQVTAGDGYKKNTSVVNDSTNAFQASTNSINLFSEAGLKAAAALKEAAAIGKSSNGKTNSGSVVRFGSTTTTTLTNGNKVVQDGATVTTLDSNGNIISTNDAELARISGAEYTGKMTGVSLNKNGEVNITYSNGKSSSVNLNDISGFNNTKVSDKEPIKIGKGYVQPRVSTAATGALLFEGGLVNHSELGSELLIPASGYIDAMQYGSTIVPRQQAENIMKWGTLSPSDFKAPEISSNLIDKSLSQQISIGTIQLTEVQKFDDFLPAMNSFLKRTVPVTRER